MVQPNQYAVRPTRCIVWLTQCAVQLTQSVRPPPYMEKNKLILNEYLGIFMHFESIFFFNLENGIFQTHPPTKSGKFQIFFFFFFEPFPNPFTFSLKHLKNVHSLLTYMIHFLSSNSLLTRVLKSASLHSNFFFSRVVSQCEGL